MQLNVRDIEPQDMDECLRLLRARRPFFGEFMQRNGIEQQVARNWNRLLAHPAINHGLAEDLSYPSGSRIFNFGFVGFVRREWLKQYLLHPKPGCGIPALVQVEHGAGEMLLTGEMLKQTNCAHSGLIAVTLITACAPERVYASLDSVQSSLDAYLHAIRGYNLAEILMEGAGAQEKSIFLASGSTRLRHVFPLPEEEHTAPENVPFLVGLRRDEAEQEPHRTSFSARVFRHNQVRFFLSASQQSLVRSALKYPSDRELLQHFQACGHKLGGEGLARRWSRIFKRVERLQPPEHPVIPRGSSPSSKRTRVLMYFERAFHELRPNDYKTKVAHRVTP